MTLAAFLEWNQTMETKHRDDPRSQPNYRPRRDDLVEFEPPLDPLGDTLELRRPL